MSKNLIGDEGFGIILDALVLRPECPLQGLGYVHLCVNLLDFSLKIYYSLLLFYIVCLGVE